MSLHLYRLVLGHLHHHLTSTQSANRMQHRQITTSFFLRFPLQLQPSRLQSNGKTFWPPNCRNSRHRRHQHNLTLLLWSVFSLFPRPRCQCLRLRSRCWISATGTAAIPLLFLFFKPSWQFQLVGTAAVPNLNSKLVNFNVNFNARMIAYLITWFRVECRSCAIYSPQ